MILAPAIREDEQVERQRRWVHAALLIAIVVYPMLFIWQGLDFTDTGFAISNYQQIFHAPESISYWGFGYWLTNVIGGAWLAGFGGLGLIGIRLASVLTIYAANAVVFITLHAHLHRTWLLLGILASELFVERMYWLNYDNLTALFFVVTACLLVHGLKRSSLAWLFAAGIFCGLNVFVRLPNVLGLDLAFAIVLYGWMNRVPFRRQCKQVIVFIVGSAAAVAAILLVMHAIGQYRLFLAAIRDLVQIVGGHSNTHDSGNLVKAFHQDYTLAVHGLAFAGSGLAALAALLTLIRRLNMPFIQYAVIYAAVIVAFYVELPMLKDRYHMVAYVTGILYAILVLCIARYRKRDPILSAISFIALVVLFTAPLGSDLGIRLAVYGMYLALPVAVNYLGTRLLTDVPVAARLGHVQPWTRIIAFTRKEWIHVMTLVLLVWAGLACNAGYHYTYRDASDRMSMRFPVNNPLLRGVLTTQSRAVVVQQLVDALPHYVRTDDYLLAYEETSLVYYLTGTRPYLYTSWPMLYSPDRFEQALQRAQTEHSRLPVIVRATATTADFNWPNVNHVRRDDRHDGDRVIMDGFIQQRGYTVAWQNGFFQILVPPGH